MKITNFKKKKIKLLNKQQLSYENAKIGYICKEKLEIIVIRGECRGAIYDICNLNSSVSKEISIVFHNGCNYDYHFMMKKLSEDFKEKFSCLGENNEKYILFLVPIEKEVTII